MSEENQKNTFVPIEESDLKSEKAKKIAAVYRIINKLYDSKTEKTNLSFNDFTKLQEVIVESIESFKAILIKNISGMVTCFTGKEDDIKIFIDTIFPKNIKTANDPAAFSAVFTNILPMIGNKQELTFSKTKDSPKYNFMDFGKCVDAYESGKMTIDEINDTLWKIEPPEKENLYDFLARRKSRWS